MLERLQLGAKLFDLDRGEDTEAEGIANEAAEEGAGDIERFHGLLLQVVVCWCRTDIIAGRAMCQLPFVGETFEELVPWGVDALFLHLLLDIAPKGLVAPPKGAAYSGHRAVLVHARYEGFGAVKADSTLGEP